MADDGRKRVLILDLAEDDDPQASDYFLLAKSDTSHRKVPYTKLVEKVADDVEVVLGTNYNNTVGF